MQPAVGIGPAKAEQRPGGIDPAGGWQAGLRAGHGIAVGEACPPGFVQFHDRQPLQQSIHGQQQRVARSPSGQASISASVSARAAAAGRRRWYGAAP